MLKILIADDEWMAREGLKKIITGYNRDYVVCGLAEDGRQAIELIKKERPDIVITDIRMPDINGIELMKWIAENTPEVRCIVLSGYDEVEYLHEALSYNATEYLLKPLKKKMLFSVLDRLSEKVNKDRLMLKKGIAAKNTYRRIFENFCSEMIYDNKYNREQIESFFEDNGITLDAGGKFRLMLVANSIANNIFIKNSNSGDISLMNYGIKNIIDELLQETGINAISFFVKNNLIVFICENTECNVISAAEEIRQRLIEVLHQKITVGISSEFEGIEQSAAAFRQAREAMCRRIIEGCGVYEYLNEGNSEAGRLIEYSKRIMSAVESLDKGKVRDITDKLEMQIRSDKMYSHSDIFGMIDDFIYRIKIFINERRYISIDDFTEKFSAAAVEFETVRQVKEYITDIAQWIIERAEENLKEGVSKKILEIKRYIEENYYKNISLNEVADMFFISANYLSERFKREVGCTFMDYLTRIRIEHAKILLKEDDLTVGEICSMVGYENSTYFNKVFKRKVGVSPGQYRRKLIK